MDNEADTATTQNKTGEIVIPCDDLDKAITFLVEHLGFRLDMIMPADAPRIATVSGHGVVLRLETPVRPTEAGRAGMHYRDLVPGRLGGRFIASLIGIPGGGPVPDYVHYHRVHFQIIYCRRGWVRVVYEDQGPPFVMQAGDCILQPPTIRHRVLEASPGLEVIELGRPAEHETWREHDFDLPTELFRPDRDFAGQRFVHHVAADAVWQNDSVAGLSFRDLGIFNATHGLANLRVRRAGSQPCRTRSRFQDGELMFLFALDGSFRLLSDALGDQTVAADDVCVIATGANYSLELAANAQVLEFVLPAAQSAS